MKSAGSVGPYDVFEELGRGAMGTVWRAKHRILGKEVALKVVGQGKGPGSTSLLAFDRELQAIAAVNHPRIVPVYDCGHIRDGEFLKNGIEESRWLAMELAEAGTLEDVSFTNWARLRSVLLQILDGLAHAHARHIIHRDLKPGNILVRTANENQIEIWLTDFGISHFSHTNQVEGTQDVLFRTAGTPVYMAPEQLRGTWRDYGPWTDLYSLGCMAFEFAHGRPPFVASSAVEIAMMHLQDPVPALKPKFNLPDGVQSWIRRALAKDRFDRFRDSAEAAQMLRGFVATAKVREAPQVIDPFHMTLEALPPEVIQTQRLELNTIQPILAADRKDETPTAEPPNTTPWSGLPDWRESNTSQSIHGLELFEYRDPYLLGHDATKATIWKELEKVHVSQKPRLLALTGSNLTFKSQLVSWSARRSSELGIATALTTGYEQRGHHFPALQLVEEALVTIGMQGDALQRRIDDEIETDLHAWQPEERYRFKHLSNDLFSLLNQSDGATPDIVDAVYAYSVITRWLSLISIRRPVLLAVENLDKSPTIVELIKYIMRNQVETLPCLIVLLKEETTQKDAVPSTLNETLFKGRKRQINFENTVGYTEHLVKELNVKEVAEIIRGSMTLTENAVEQITQAAQHCPLLSFQALSLAVENATLEATEGGFDFVSAKRNLPATPEGVLMARLYHYSARYGWSDNPRLEKSLQVCAILGGEIRWDLWKHLCEEFDCVVPVEVFSGLGQTKILALNKDGWSFRFHVLREHLAQSFARTEDEIRAHTLAAAWLRANTPQAIDEICYHLLASKSDETRAFLVQAAESRLRTSNYQSCLHLCDFFFALSEHEGASLDDLARRAWLAHSRAHFFMGAHPEGRKALKRATAGDLSKSDVAVRASSLLLRATQQRGDHTRHRQTEKLFRDAARLFRLADDLDGESQCYHGLGWLALGKSDITQAKKHFQTGLETARKHNVPQQVGWCLHGLAFTNVNESIDGTAYLEEAITAFSKSRSYSGMGACHVLTATFHRRAERLHQAEVSIEMALHFLQASNSQILVHALIERIFLDLHSGAYKDTGKRLELLEANPMATMHPAVLLLIRFTSATVALMQEDEQTAQKFLALAQINFKSNYVPGEVMIAKEYIAFLQHLLESHTTTNPVRDHLIAALQQILRALA